MTTGLLAGCLVVAFASAVRIRPDPRLRGSPPIAAARRGRCLRPRLLRGMRLLQRRTPSCGPADIASWCDALARELRSGASLGAALRTVTPPVGSSLADIPHRLSRGQRLADALALPNVSPHEQAALTVLAACAEHGGPAAQPLDRLAGVMRRRAADAAERAVHSAQARLSALVMTLLPGGVLVLLLTTSPSVRGIVGTPLGAGVVGAGLGLNGLGWLWMRRIVVGRAR